MKNLNIPPVYLALLLTSQILAFIFLPDFNIVKFPYSLSGILFIAAGFMIAGKTRDILAKHKTTHKFDDPVHLVTEGVFSRTRNPMYSGMILFLLGFSLIFGNIFGMLTPFIFASIVNFIFIPIEEKKLEYLFGNAYFEYKNKVGRWI